MMYYPCYSAPLQKLDEEISMWLAWLLLVNEIEANVRSEQLLGDSSFYLVDTTVDQA